MRRSGKTTSPSRWRRSQRRSPDSSIRTIPSRESPATSYGASRVRWSGRRLEGRSGASCSTPTSHRPGGINFTIAHEFGHYLLHRASYPEGFNCSTEDMVRWDTEYGRVEHQANVFASYLLMPLDDFRRQLSPSAVPDLDALGGCADRYDVSLTASALKWLSYTDRRAVLVVSRDGYILWAWSSKGGVPHRRVLQDGESASAPDPGGVAGRTWARG